MTPTLLFSSLRLYVFLVDGNRKIHIRVDGTVKMEGPGCREGADTVAIIAVELDIVHRGGAALLHIAGNAVGPRPVCDDVGHGGIVDQIDTLALIDGDVGLHKI